MARYLIVNADDFGLSEGVNRGITEAAERGIVTSASLMVRQPAASDAAARARDLGISIGLHLDLGEWVLKNQEWVPLYSVVPTDNAQAVFEETSRQLAEFRRLMGRNPTHIDSHQHVHRSEPVRSLVLKLAGDLAVPVREYTPGVHYCGDFYGQGAEGETLENALSVQNLKQILSSLPDGVAELGCHPGYGDSLATAYREERARELAVLCAPEIRTALPSLGIKLCSFSDLPRLGAAGLTQRRKPVQKKAIRPGDA